MAMLNNHFSMVIIQDALPRKAPHSDPAQVSASAGMTFHIAVAVKSPKKRWENHGKTMGKPWENGDMENHHF